MSWIELLRDLSAFGIAIGALGWVTRSLGQHFISKRFAAYQSELDRVSQQQRVALEQDLEKHRSALSLEHLKYSRIHERRLEVMTELYRVLVALDEAMRQVTAIVRFGGHEDWKTLRAREIEEARQAFHAFRSYFLTNRILLTEQTCDQIAELLEEYSVSFRIGTFADRYGTSGERTLDMEKEASAKVREHIPPLLRKLERDVRHQLGAAGAS